VVGKTKNVEVHDRIAVGASNHVDDPSQERFFRVAPDNDRTGRHPLGFGRPAEERPDKSGLVDLIRGSRIVTSPDA